MSAAVQDLLSAFDALPAGDRAAAFAELARRQPAEEGGLPDAAFEELVEELFLTYDAEEAADAAPVG